MRVICPNCNKVIEVDDDTRETAFCSECGSSFSMEQGKRLEAKKYAAIYARGYQDLTTLGNYEEAISMFNNCLLLRPNDMSSIIGIALANLYSQDFLNLKFNKIEDIINEYDIVLDSENTLLFLNFIDDTIQEVELFFNQVDLRIIKDNKFISLKYKNSYLSGLNDIEHLFNFFLESLSLCDQNELETFFENENMKDKIESIIKKVKERQSLDLEVMENEETLDDNRISKIKGVVGSKNTMVIGSIVIGLLILAIVFIVLGATLKNNIFYYLCIVPAILGALIYFLYKKKINS